jgi:hypothetical protein
VFALITEMLECKNSFDGCERRRRRREGRRASLTVMVKSGVSLGSFLDG